jgi:hypothetical protein
MFRADKKIPVARSEDLLVESVGDETVVYDLDSKQAHCLKPLAAFVFAHSDGHTGIDELAKLAAHRFGDPVSIEQLAETVSELEAVDLLERPPVLVQAELSRREMVRKVAFAGATAAVAGSMVTTIGAPTALASCSNQGAGCSCDPNSGTSNKTCASNHCCSVHGGDKCNIGCCADNNGVLCKCTSMVPATCPSAPGNPIGCCVGKCVPQNQPC